MMFQSWYYHYAVLAMLLTVILFLSTACVPQHKDSEFPSLASNDPYARAGSAALQRLANGLLMY